MNIQLPNSLAARDRASVLHPYTDLRAHDEKGPHIITHASGIHLHDDEGRSFIDGLAGLWCAGLGHGNARVVAAATKQMQEMSFSHSFAHRSNPVVIELAEQLTRLAPEPITRAFFVNSGSEAIDAAIQIVWYYNNALGRPEKKKIIGRERAYHGVTVAAGSLTALPYKQDGFDLPISDRFLKVTCPHHYRQGAPGESETDFAARLAAELEERIIAEGPETVAAFIGEPVMGAGGVLVPPQGYWPAVAEICKRHDILLICDEVINGFGRTGNWWGSETVGVVPDIMTCAKQLSAAYLPIGATLMTEAVYDVLAESSARHGVFGVGMTYGGHPVCAAVAREVLSIYEEEDIIGHVREVSPLFQARFRALGNHPLIGEVRGVGLIGAMEIVADKESRTPFDPSRKAAPTVYGKIQERGVLGRPLPGDTFALCPPMIMTEDQIDEMFDAVELGLEDAARDGLA